MADDYKMWIKELLATLKDNYGLDRNDLFNDIKEIKQLYNDGNTVKAVCDRLEQKFGLENIRSHIK